MAWLEKVLGLPLHAGSCLMAKRVAAGPGHTETPQVPWSPVQWLAWEAILVGSNAFAA